MPAQSLKELVAWLKTNPGKATAGTAGAGSGAPVAGVFFPKLNGAIRAALAVPAVKDRFLELGQEISSPDKLTPEAFRRHQSEETEKWWPIVKAANIKAE